MRLIDADALGIGPANTEVFRAPGYAGGWNNAISVITSAPTVDAVCAVRCRDCRHSYEDLGGLTCAFGPCVDCVVEPDFYCAAGERMDGDGPCGAALTGR